MKLDAGSMKMTDAGTAADAGLPMSADAGLDAGGITPDAAVADASVGGDAGWSYAVEFQEQYLRDTLPNNLIADVVAAGTTILVATPMGLSRSNDNGGTWRNFTVKDGLTENSVSFLSTNGTEVDVTMGGTGTGFVARFSLATNTLRPHPAQAALSQRPLYAMFSGSCEYVITSVDGNLQHAAWKSCDAGATFQKLFEFTATNFFARNFAVDGTTIAFTSLDWPQNKPHLVVSIDNGATFNEVPTPEPRAGYDLRGLAVQGKTIYAALSENRPSCTLFSSPDAGADFSCASPNAVGFVNKASVIDGLVTLSGNAGLVRVAPATGAIQTAAGSTLFTLSHAKLGAGFLSATTQGLDLIDSQLLLTATRKNALLNRNFQIFTLAANGSTVYAGTAIGWVELDTGTNTATTYTVSGLYDGTLRFPDNVYDLAVSRGKLYVASTDITVVNPADRAHPKTLAASAATFRQTYALREHGEHLYASGNWGFAQIDPATDTLVIKSSDATKQLRHFEFLNNRLLFDAINTLYISDDLGATTLPVDTDAICPGTIESLAVWQGTGILVCQRKAYSSADGETWALMSAPCTKPDRVSAVHAAGGNLFWACAEGMRMQAPDGAVTLLALPRSLSAIEGDFSVLPVADRWYFGSSGDGLVSAKHN